MRWLIENWHDLLPQPWTSIAQVVVAVICGGIIGVERERKQKAVGFRTLALVSLGATVFTMISASLNHVTPISGQIVSGIGFLGAGVILRGPFGITGLTSAATIWAMAAVGMTVGIGYAGAGLALSVFLLGAMLLISLSEQRYVGACRYRWAVLTFQVDGGKSLIRIEEVLDEYRLPRGDYEILPSPLPANRGDPPAELRQGQLRLRYCDAHRHHREFLAYLAAMPEIEEINREPRDAAPAPRD
jgi:putative Mg2+ transporter-C (MgtC) family protein